MGVSDLKAELKLRVRPKDRRALMTAARLREVFALQDASLYYVAARAQAQPEASPGSSAPVYSRVPPGA